MSDGISRRDFVRTAALAAAGPMIVPRHVLGRGYRAPSDTLNVAIVGAGGMGMENWNGVLRAGENVVAICDVDMPFVERALTNRLRPPRGQTASTPEALAVKASYEKAAKYADFREMLSRQRDIDAVVVATPDHTHAPVAYHAMRAGKHVYVQKPLTYSVYEARLLARAARETRVTTQMGNQGHSMEGTRRIKEWVQAGVIGPVREVHIWTDRPLRYWPQGIPRPGQDVDRRLFAAAQRAQQQAAQPQAPPPTVTTNAMPATPPGPPPPPRWSMATVENAVLREMATNPLTPPPGLDWDLFVGPVARDIPYHPVYHPFSWRGWTDFGVSAIGDMGAHLMDQAYWALDLGLPARFMANSSPWGGWEQDRASYPMAMTARFDFPARGTMPPLRMFWYDGGLMPNQFDVPFPGSGGGGGILVGDRGWITHETYGSAPKVFPESLAAEAERVPKTIPRIETSHEKNFCDACKGLAQASSPFDYAAPLTEIMLLGVVAIRTGSGKVLEYDAPNMRVTNVPEANQYLTREYRKGWEL